MGPDDRPFSERMWGLGRQLSPSDRGRQGCMVLLVGALVLVVVVLLITAAVAALL